ncbi:cytadherence protein B [Mycoplasma bradburyae]|uniref:Cytadherence protein B n=1 Tax=Mycoplasma bradburyae TaxID=2963128 RepID=A0ABT5GAY0_9MOLU|nr:cytadherence protein B [Mycoplasma bradburyae]MDC4182141.1 cytadherence protein B [Mycoplasma bradburyae]UTS70290.1 cytadherence protein B [Mycoplasma bradburyae]
MFKKRFKKYFILFIILLITAISLVFLELFNCNPRNTNLVKQSASLVEDNQTNQIIKNNSLSKIRWNANANFSSSPTSDGGLLALSFDGGLERIDSFGYLKWKFNLNDFNRIALTDSKNNLVYSGDKLVLRRQDNLFINSIYRKIVAEAIQSKEDQSIYYVLLVSEQILNNDVKSQLFSFQELSTDVTLQGTILKIKEDLNHISNPIGIIDYVNIPPSALIDNYPSSWKSNTPTIYGVNGSFKKEDHPSWFSANSNFISLPWLQYITNLANLYEYKNDVFIFGGNGNWINDDQKDRKEASKYLSIGVFRARFYNNYSERPIVTGYPYAYLLSSLTAVNPDTQRVLLGQNKNYTLVPRIAVAGVKPGLNNNKNYIFLFGSVTTGLSADDNSNEVVLNKQNYEPNKLATLNSLSSIPLSANNAQKNSVGPKVLAGFFFNLSDLAKLDNKIDESNVDRTYYLNQNSYGFRLIAPWTTETAQPNIDALNIASDNKSVEGTLHNLTVRHGFNENDVGGLIILDDNSYAVQVGPYILEIDGPSAISIKPSKFNFLYRLSNQDFIDYDINGPLNFTPIFNFKDFRGIKVVNSNENYLFSLFAPDSTTATNPKFYYSSFSDQKNKNVNFNSRSIKKSNGLLQFNSSDALYLQNEDYSYNIYSLSANNIQNNGIINPIAQRVKFLGSGEFISTRSINLSQTNLADLFDIKNDEVILKNDLIKNVYEYFPSNKDKEYKLKLKVVDLDYEQSKFKLVPYVYSDITKQYEIIPNKSDYLNSDNSFGNFNGFLGIDQVYLYMGIFIPLLILIIGMVSMTIVGLSLIKERRSLLKSFKTNTLKMDGLVLSIGSVFKSLIHSSRHFKRLSAKEKADDEHKQQFKMLNGKTKKIDNNIINKQKDKIKQDNSTNSRVNFAKMREYKQNTKMVINE